MAAYQAVRFLETRVVQDARAGTPDETRFDKDSVHVLPWHSAQHWLKRGLAKEEDMPDVVSPEKVSPSDPMPDAPDSADWTADEITDMAVADAIAELDPDNPAHWTASGKPAVDALSAILGRTVTAAERDAALD